MFKSSVIIYMKKLLVILALFVLVVSAENLQRASRIVRWKSSPTNEYVVKYNVYWQNKSVKNSPTNVLSARTNYCLIKYLTKEDTYSFWITAVNQWGDEGKPSQVVTKKLYYDK